MSQAKSCYCVAAVTILLIGPWLSVAPAEEYQSESLRRARAILETPATKAFHFEAVPLGEALKSIEQASGLSFRLNFTHAPRKEDVTVETPVTVKLGHVPWRQALEAVLQSAGEGALDWGFDNNGKVIIYRKLDDPKETNAGNTSIPRVIYRNRSFYLMGCFDLDGDKFYTSKEGEQLGRLIAQRGGKLLSQIQEKVDYLVLGQNACVLDYLPPEFNASREERRAYQELTARVSEHNRITQQLCDRGAVILSTRPNGALYVLAAADPHAGESEAQRVTRRKLNATSVTCEFNNDKLINVFEYFAIRSGVSLYIDWRTLEKAGVKQDTLITTTFKPVPSCQIVLEDVLLKVGNGQLALSIDRWGIAIISTKPVVKKLTADTGMKYDEKDSETPRAKTIIKLRQPIPIDFFNNRLDSVIDYLRNATGVNIAVNWQEMEQAGVKPQAPITMELKQITGERLIQLILHTVGVGGQIEVGLLDNIVVIGSADYIKQLNAESNAWEKSSGYVSSGITHRAHISFKNNKLESVAKYLNYHGGGHIDLDWKSLEKLGVTKETPVTLQLQNVQVRHALSLIINMATKNKAKLVLDRSVLKIVSKAKIPPIPGPDAAPGKTSTSPPIPPQTTAQLMAASKSKKVIGTVSGLVTEAKVVGHRVQCWKIDAPHARPGRWQLSMRHADAGPGGAFYLTAWTDSDADGSPDTQIGRSDLMVTEKAGAWSSWEFTAPSDSIFVGNCWSQGRVQVYYRGDPPPAGYTGLGKVMYYARRFDLAPTAKASPRYTNIRLKYLPEPTKIEQNVERRTTVISEQPVASIANKKLKLAQMYQRTGKTDLAEKECRFIIENYPDTEAAVTARKHLDALKASMPR